MKNVKNTTAELTAETTRQKYKKLVPMLIDGAGYTKNEENKIQREAFADFLAGKTAARQLVRSRPTRQKWTG